jgi:hypothetical protein
MISSSATYYDQSICLRHVKEAAAEKTRIRSSKAAPLAEELSIKKGVELQSKIHRDALREFEEWHCRADFR